MSLILEHHCIFLFELCRSALLVEWNKYIKSNSQKLSNESALMYDFLEDEKYKKYNVYRINLDFVMLLISFYQLNVQCIF